MKIKDILKIGGLKESSVVAGLKAINNEVSSISVLEVAESRIETWVLEEQVYITSFYAIMQDVDKQKSVILALHNKGAAGLVICHIDLFLKEIHEDIINLGNELSFPIIVAKSEKSYVEIINPIVLKLSGEQNSEMNTIIDMQNRVIDNIVSKKDINYIYRSMAEEYNNELIFIDINYEILYPKYYSYAGELLNLIKRKQYDIERNCNKNNYYYIEINGKSKIIINIESTGVMYGYIVADYTEKNFSKNLKMLESFSSLCTLIFTKSAKINELEVIRKQEYISDLLTWNFRTDKVALQMGEDVGWNIKNKGIMIIININNLQENIEVSTPDFERLIDKILYNKIRDIVKDENKLNLLGLRSDTFIILVENDIKINHRSRKLGSALLKCCNEVLADAVSIGISSYIESYNKIPDAYSEAMDAVRIGRNFFGSNRVISIDDLGVYRYIKDISKKEDFNDFKNNFIEKIKGPNNENEELYLTLKSLIYNDMNSEDTARELFVHKNTINYRKRKIVELLGIDPWEMPHLFNTLAIITSEFFN